MLGLSEQQSAAAQRALHTSFINRGPCVIVTLHMNDKFSSCFAGDARAQLRRTLLHPWPCSILLVTAVAAQLQWLLFLVTRKPALPSPSPFQN